MAQVVYQSSIVNQLWYGEKGIFISNGSSAGSSGYNPGGNSGSGSINIFYIDECIGYSTSKVSCKSPSISGNGKNSGAGGTGSAVIGKIVNGTFEQDI